MQEQSCEIWDLLLAHIRSKIPRESFLTWFSPLKCLGFRDGVIHVEVPSRFFYEFLESHYREHIREALSLVADGDVKIEYSVLPSGEEKSSAPAAPVYRPPAVRKSGYEGSDPVNPQYTFENFVEGDSNSFAKAAALAVAEAPGKTPFNPLFIYGLTGLGKTHLLQAVGNFSLANNRNRRIVFATSEKFINDFIYSIKTYKTTDFSRFYRSADIFLLDDVQFFQGKERTQLEFFHTFNSLYQAGKQIVLTSDRPPKELNDFDKRLISRIGSGLVTDIQPPDFETRLAILQRRADREGIFLPPDVAQFIAESIRDNIRELEGALISLVGRCSIAGLDLTLELARDVLKDQIQVAVPEITVDLIQRKVAEHYNVPVDLLIARNRKKEIAWARQVAMYLCAELTGSSLVSIGVHFGNRDHSTVVHAKKTIGRMIGTSPELAREIEMIRAGITRS